MEKTELNNGGSPQNKKSLFVELGTSAIYHSLSRWITEIPFSLRAVIAPTGTLTNPNKETVSGKVVRFSGDSYVLLKKDGEFIFPNYKDGDNIIISS